MKTPRTLTNVAAVAGAMDAIAPPRAAAEWDNVGLLTGNPDWPVNRVLLAIDLTWPVLEEARSRHADVIIAYHPPIFRPVKRFCADPKLQEGIAAAALGWQISIYSPHTALDAAPGGTNDALATLCKLVDIRPFTGRPAPADNNKLVVFVPKTHLETVADALFAAGAGRIGNYEKCSYRVAGHGTFFGTEESKPALGKRGRLERVDETRLEVVIPSHGIADAVAALRASHPYEEPAFDLYPLTAAPNAHLGQGRIGRFAKPVRVSALAGRLKRATGAASVSIVGNPDAVANRALICAGAAGSLPFEQRRGPEDVVITGEVRHHDALRYLRTGAAAICLGHWASERPVLKPLSRRLSEALPGIELVISKSDRDPFSTA